MSYLRPAVLVYQEYARMSTASQVTSLNPCIIGPAYHIIDPIADDPLPFISDYSTAGIVDASFPFNAPGAKIEYTSVRVLLRQAQIRFNSAPIAGASLTDNELQLSGSAAFFASLKVGDMVELIDTDTSDSSGEPVAVHREYRIIDLNPASLSVTLDFTPPALDGTLTVNFYRLEDMLWFNASSPYLTFDTQNEKISILGLKTIIDDVEYTVTKGFAYVGYRALRADLTQLNTVYSIEEARGVFGRDMSDNNPLGFAVALTLANTNVGVTFVGVGSEDLEGYTDAKDLLEGTENIYSIVPMTTNVDVLSMFKVHVEAMSTPEEGKWRICIGSCDLPTSKIRVTGDAEVSISASDELVIVHSPTAAFLSNGVRAGQEVILTTSNGSEIAYPVYHVVSQDRVVFSKPEGFVLSVFEDATEVPFKVKHTFDKTDQAREIEGISSAYRSARFVNVWPNVCIINDKQYPGYYLGCVLAGMIGGLPSHHGFTRLSVGGVAGVRNSSDYFNKRQLDIIAGGGTFIFVQNNPASPVYSRHQLTTDMSTIEFRELSFVKNFDYVSYLSKRVLDRFIGQYNITQATLGILHTSMMSLFETLKLNSLPRIGSPVLNYSIRSLRQLEDTRDRVEIYVDVEFPYVLNVVGLHLVSQ